MILLLPACLFALLFLLQILLQNTLTIKNEDAFIFALFLILPLFLFLGCFFFPVFPNISTEILLKSYALFFFLSSSWIASYPAVYASCPTLLMAYWAKKNGSITLEQMKEKLELKNNSVERITDALHDGLIVQKNNTIFLRKKGRIFLLCFTVYRKILGKKISTL